MENIEKYDLLGSETRKEDFGVLTTLRATTGISEHGTINMGDKTLLADYIYNERSYDLVYTIVDTDGKVIDSYIEKEGILPTLFKSPGGEVFVSVIPYHPDKEMEISIPLMDRLSVEFPRPVRPFTGDFMGCVNQSAVFHDVDFSDKKPDRLLNIEFNGHQIRKKHNIKLGFPNNNKVRISNNEIHLMAREDKSFVHRRIDEAGNELQIRRIDRNGQYFREVLELSFDGVSQLVMESDGKVILWEIDNAGNILSRELMDIGDDIFSTWAPVEIADDTFVIRFTTEYGNGWFTLLQGQLVEFFYGKGLSGYRNLLTGEFIRMDHEHLVLAGLNKTKANSYAVVFYPVTDRDTKNKELIILNRTIS